MLEITSKFKLDASAISSSNLCGKFSDQELSQIGEHCYTGYDQDEKSRADWLKRNEAGMDLALQVQKDKSFPWPGCANVAFPLVTIAAMQFHARAYPAIVGGDNIVKCKVFGEDPDGTLTKRATAVSEKMSWQLMYEDKCWEDQEDKAIFNVSIVGCNFKKSYRSAAKKANISELVLAKNLVLNYWSKSVNDCPRKTHIMPTYRNEVYENVVRKRWRDVLKEAWYEATPAETRTTTRIQQDNRQGVTPPQPDDTTPLIFLEQHVNLDLDCDGYAEPYVVTFEKTSKCVVRIITRFDREADIERASDGKIICIKATEYFTKKTFIPSPDGGIYDIGFGVFLGPLNEAVNSLVNMLLDCGTMQTTGGGFLGRGAKIRGGQYTVAPFEWKRVDSTGDDLRKSIFPLPVNQPSDVLFQLLSLLINYTSRVSGTTDITVGENPGQNTPAETSRPLVARGQKIYTAIFKRLWRSSKEEFEKLYRLNGLFLEGPERELFQGNGYDICPVADPNITSDSMKVQLAGTLVGRAAATPGYNKDEVERMFLRAVHCDNIKTIYPGTEGQPPQEDPKLVLQREKDAAAMERLQTQLESDQRQFVISLQEERILTQAKILELQAKAQNEAANAQTEQAYAQVAMINAEIGRLKVISEHQNSQLDKYIKLFQARSDHHIGIQGLANKSAEKAAA